MSTALGIDIGGTGIKASLVDLLTGDLASRRVRVATPKPSSPSIVADAVRNVVDLIASDVEVALDAPVGCTLPGVIKRGVAYTAANIDKEWIGTSVEKVIGSALVRQVYALNDADAAAIAEARLGAARDVRGTVLLLTIGTGIGSGLLVDGRLVPNTEFGHLEFRGKDAEKLLSGVARERRGLRWKQWALEFNDFLARLELYVSPDLFVLGGGVSKAMSTYDQWLKSNAPIVPARFLNLAGIIGAALAAAEIDAAVDANLPVPPLSAVSEG